MVPYGEFCRPHYLVPNPVLVRNPSVKRGCILHLCLVRMSPDFDCLAYNFHGNNCMQATPNLTYMKDFFSYFIYSFYMWDGWSALVVVLLSPCAAGLPVGRALAICVMIPQNQHSGCFLEFSLWSFLCSVLNVPTVPSVVLAIIFNCWLVCSVTLHISIALYKVVYW